MRAILMDNDFWGEEFWDGGQARREMAEQEPHWTVSQFLDAVNQTLSYAYGPGVEIEGEVASFKVNQGKWVFFDLKDEESSVSCFLPLFKLRMPIEDGMKIVVKAEPKLTKWGKFSLTVQQMRPVGEGNLKKSFELLKKKLAQEGLFDVTRKRSLPRDLRRIGVISSTQAAGYADFCKILNARWGGLEVQTAHTQVQGLDAPDQMIRALKYFNEKADVDVIAIIRGGGSADDLSAFNDEELVRAIASSRIPVITGIGHEVDESLADLAADVRASTPSNVAEMLTPDREEKIIWVENTIAGLSARIVQEIEAEKERLRTRITEAVRTLKLKLAGVEVGTRTLEIGRMLKMKIDELRMNTKVVELGRVLNLKIENVEAGIVAKVKILEGVNPDLVLKRGYAIVSGNLKTGDEVRIVTLDREARALVKTVKERK